MDASTRTASILALALGASLTLAGSAAAQTLVEPEARQGYYLSGSLRFGVTTTDSTVGSLGTMTHQGGWFRVGQKPLPWLGLGLAFGGGAEASDDWSLGYGGVAMEGEIEPFPDLDLAIRLGTGVGGGGASRSDASLETDDDPDFAFGPIFSAGVSYEWFPFYDRSAYDSGGFGLSLFLEGRYFAGGDVSSGGGFLGIELTWWTGLDKRKLELPLDEAF